MRGTAANGYLVCGCQRLSHNAFAITLTELNAMAAPANTGFKKPKAANGIPATLYTNAQNKFCRILRTVRREM